MNSKKSIIALLLVAIVGVVGLTIAYFTNSANIENEFRTNSYGTTFVEEFVSPDNWTPGTTTTKTLTVTNSGNVDEAVRVEYIESWTSKNGDPLPLKQNGNDVAIINWANNYDWTPVTEKGKNYYYYNFKLAPTEVTSTLLDSVTFNSLVTNGSNCTTNETNGATTITCDSTGDGYDGATYTLTFKAQTVQYDKYKEAWGTNMVIAAERPESPVPDNEYLANNATNVEHARYNSETKGNLFVFTYPQTGQTPAQTDFRYIGDAPNNYVKFNCDNDGTNCETWRMIGVFNVDDGTGNVEQRIKLLRDSEFESRMAFGSTNDWTVSSLNTFLNGDYYNRTGDAATYGLKESAQNMIGDAVFYLGAVSADYNATAIFGTTEKIYGEERGTTVCGLCNSDTSKLTWTGKVALMYPSDGYMVYGNGVNTTCYDNPKGCGGTDADTGWIYKSGSYVWLLSAGAGGNSSQQLILNGSYLNGKDSSIPFTLNVRPVVYLKSSVQIVDGDGGSGNPYVLQ